MDGMPPLLFIWMSIGAIICVGHLIHLSKKQNAFAPRLSMAHMMFVFAFFCLMWPVGVVIWSQD